MRKYISGRFGWLLMLAPILAIAMIASLIHGFTLTLVAFVFESWGYDARFVGLNAAVGACGILLLGPFFPKIVTCYGIPRILTAALALGSFSLAGMAVLNNVFAWFAFKAMLGLSLSVMWVGAELWINLRVDDTHRGRAFSLFTMLYWFGFACGPGIIGLTGITGSLPLFVGAGILIVALPLTWLCPVSGASKAESIQDQTIRLPLYSMLMVLSTAIIAGMGDGTLGALLPTFGLEHGLSQVGAGTLLTAAVVGGVAFQWPIGWLADNASERFLSFACIAGAGLCLVLLPLAVTDVNLRLVLSFMIGGLIMSVSTLGLVMIGRIFCGGLLTIMSTWFSVLYEVGATVGPAVGGITMVHWGANGLPLMLAIFCGAACIAIIVATISIPHPSASPIHANARLAEHNQVP